MVRKLLKYEFSAFAKTILPMELILLGVAALTRFVQLFENGGATYKIFSVSSIVMLVISMIVCVVMTVAVCVIRFYKNLYTAEGYLTLTLPVTHTAHIFAKLIFSVCASAFSLVSVAVAGIIATAGDVLHEIIKAISYLIKQYNLHAGINAPFHYLELLLFIVSFTAAVYLLLFTCITIGQRAHKNRILAAFGVYFCYYVIKQLLGTLLIILYVSFYKYLPIAEIKTFMATHQFATTHIILIFLTVFELLFSVLCFFITRNIMKKKLNLE